MAHIQRRRRGGKTRWIARTLTPDGRERTKTFDRRVDAERWIIWEVRAAGDRQAFRILFAPEGRRSQVLLALDGFSKKTRRTPPESIKLAERRLADWRSRGVSRS